MAKFPKILHIPSSLGLSRGDKRLDSIDSFLKREVVFTLKLDGSNVCLTRDNLYARSHSGKPIHPSFAWLKAFHSYVKYDIPENMEVFCEYTYAVHTIKYKTLPGYLWIIGIRVDGKLWLSWDDIKKWSRDLGIFVAPFLCYTFSSNERAFNAMANFAETKVKEGLYGVEDEGFVIRVTDAFSNEDFSKSVAKWVRKDFVPVGTEHWTKGDFVKQELCIINAE